MPNYHLYLKSHCDAPDFEAEVEAENLDKAALEFQRRWCHDFDLQTIKQNIEII